MAANMYRVGDYVYFENSSSNPYLIRRIEELNKTANGNVEAKVLCLFRRRDLSGALNNLADNGAREFEEETQQPSLPEAQKHQLKHREIFLSRQFESLPATHIRGKCNVTLLNETDLLGGYLEKEDCFYYSLVFDPMEKTLLADQGEIRVGLRYQAEIPDKLAEGVSDGRMLEKLETMVWDPDNQLKDPEIDQFLVVARAIGTFARALDCSSSIRQPSLHMSAAAASRDITLFHAMDTLQRSGYDLAQAMCTLVPRGGPVLCRDEMEEWSASEAVLFEDALEKYGKDFTDIRQDFLPWKSLASIVQFYYMWKTTDRYIQQKRLKAAEADSKLKQVYIPTYTKPNPNQILVPGSKPGSNGTTGFQKGHSCESCHSAHSQQWYAWGPPSMQCRLCASCWVYWKKYGGLKTPTQLEGAVRGSSDDAPRSQLTPPEVQDMSPFAAGSANRAKLLAKNRQTFLLQASALTRLARRLCADVLRPRRAARRPYAPVSATALRTECMARLPKAPKGLLKPKPAKSRPALATVVKKLALQTPQRLKPSRGPPVPINRNQSGQPRAAASLLGKRPLDAPPSNGRALAPSVQNAGQSVIKRQKVNNGDSPNPVVFVATKDTRALRKALNQGEMRRAARKPHLLVKLKAAPVPVLAAVSSEPIVLED
ncbi:metastasis-associated protein MTA2-like [Paramormyrops kingsleyae]|uniref:metastasis-associated protein MTA2-like n=1 Tax=Paramormyrops kingsleyae TaxID=1676925 RepID=UPI000CD664B3|nr:metastasis-associated protein MTA2-like [Paramormyrops kingsleyae]